MTDYAKLISDDDPYARLIQGEQAQALRGAMAGAASTQPDVEAKLQQLSKRVGVPVDSVRVDPVQAERQSVIGSIDYGRLVRDNPITANFLTKQAAVARDDVGTLTRIERAFTAFGQGVAKGSLQDDLGPLHYKAMVGTITPAEQARRKALADKMKALDAQPEKGDSPLSWFLNVTGYTGRQMVSSIREAAPGAVVGAGAGATVGAMAAPVAPITVTGGAALGARAGYISMSTVYNYKTEAGFAFDEFEQIKTVDGKPLPRDVAQGAAAAVGLINAGLETVGEVALLKLAPGLDKLLAGGARQAVKTMLQRPTFRAAIAAAGKKWVKASSIEGVTEGLQEITVILGRELAQGVAPGEYAATPIGQDVERVAQAAAEGAAGAAGVGAPATGVRAGMNIREVRIAQRNQDFMTALGESAQASKLRERLPEVFRDFVSKAREAGPVENVYIPADQFARYFQSQNVDPAAVAAEVGAANFSEAMAAGTDVVIPLENYAEKLAATQHHSGLLQDVKLHQGDLTMREAQALEQRQQELQAELEAMIDRESGKDQSPAVEQIKQDMMGELVGRFERSTADAYATTYAKTIATLAQRAGIDPMELHRTYGLRVVTPLPAILQQQPNIDTALDPLLDRLRAGDIPSETLSYGPSLFEFIRDRGGLRPIGETRAMDENVTRRPFERKMTQPDGMSLDAALEAAVEAGYFPGREPGTLSEADLLDALANDAGGNRIYSPQFRNNDLAGLREQLNALQEYIAQLSGDLSMDNAALRELIMRAAKAQPVANAAGAKRIIPIRRFGDLKQSRFYSALSRGIESMPTKSATSQGWKDAIKGLVNKGQVKTDEIEWTGINDWLDLQQGKVTKEQVAGYLQQGGVRVKEVTLGERRAAGWRDISRALADTGLSQSEAARIAQAAASGDEEAVAEAMAYGVDVSEVFGDDGAGSVKYSKYTLPGGENYREVLLTLPDKLESKDSIAQRMFGKSYSALSDEERFAVTPEYQKGMRERYKSTHWDQPNVLAHIRVNDRTDADGKRVLFVEELQSDWGQEGKKKGFASDSDIKLVSRKEYDAFVGKMLDDYIEQRMQAGESREEAGRRGINMPFPQMAQELGRSDEYARMRAGRDLDMQGGSDKIPAAPFVTKTEGWLNLALKQVISMAAKEGYDRVAFTNGEQNAERYDLSKQVDDLRYGDGTLVALRNGQIVLSKEATPEELPDLVGKEVADRLLKAPKMEGDGYRRLSGLDLKVGGEGMKAFYDQIVPAALKKLLPKMGGGQVGIVQLPNMRGTELRADADRLGMSVDDVLDLAGEDEYAGGQPGFDVTDAMRAKAISGLPLFQPQPNAPPRGFFSPSENIITLLKDADLSTFLHESGHFWLEVLGDLAERADATEQIKADYQTLLDWFGVKSRAEITVEHHEKFARANEAYLMEGKAPSAELRGIFQRFRAWLSLIYRTIQQLNVQLNDDVRAVLDRIYATDEEIEAANRQLDAVPLFTTAADAGMTEVEFAAYRKSAEAASEAAKEKLQVELMREYQRAREKWWKDQRAAMRIDVEAEVDATPVYRAFAALVDGKLPDGTPLKLSKGDLVRRYGEEYIKRLPRGFARIYSADGGTSVDVAAEALGFDSGDTLVEALVNMRPRKELIEAETDARMAQQYGDMMLDGTIAEEAMQAIHNEQRAKVIEAELRALRRQQATVRPVLNALARADAQARQTALDIPPAAVFRAAAAGRIGQMQAKDINPYQYLLAERRASRAAYEAAAKKDYVTAATEKQRELMNHYLYLEATKAKQEIEKVYAYMGRFEKPATRQKLAKVGADYLDQIDAILERYEFKRVSLAALAKRQSLADFVEQMEQQGLLVNIPDELLDEARRVNYRQATVDELRAVRDTVKNIEHLATLKDKLLRKREAIEFAAVKTELIESARDNFKPTGELSKPNRKGETVRDKGARLWKWFDAKHLKVEQLVEWLDGGKIDGPWARYLFDQAADAQTREYGLHAMVTAKLQELAESMPKEWRDSLADKTGVTLPGLDGPVTRYTLLSLALNTGNAGNLQRLRDGYGWSDATVASALGALTADDARFVQGVWDTVNSLWPEIVALEKRVTGIAPPKVEAAPVTIGGVEVAGGYFPLVYDSRLSAVGEKQAEATESVGQFLANAYGRARTDRGYTKQRVETLKAPVLLDFEQVLTSHLTRVIKDVSHREAIYSLNKILKDGEIKAALIDTVGEEQYRELNKWVQVLVADRADTLHQATGAAKLIMQFRTNMAIVTMGWKISTMLAQFAGFGPSMDLVKPRYLTQALVDFNRYGPWSSHRETLANMVYEKSGEMKFRSDTIERDVRDSLRRMQGDNSPLAAVRKTAFYLTAMADRQVTIPTWLGAYRQALAEGLTEEAAVRAGDRAVRLSQGSGGTKDLAAVQRDNELMRLLTMYYSPFSVLYARLRDLGHTTRRVEDMPRAVARVIALVVLPAVLGDLLAAKGPGDDEDKVWWAIRKALLYPLSSIPVVRDLSGYLEARLISLAGDGEMKFAPSFTLSPVVGAMDRLARLVFLRIPEAVQGARQWDDVAWDAVEASGYVLGLPTAQIRITGEYITDVLTDQAHPESPQQALHDLLFKRPAERQ